MRLERTDYFPKTLQLSLVTARWTHYKGKDTGEKDHLQKEVTELTLQTTSLKAGLDENKETYSKLLEAKHESCTKQMADQRARMDEERGEVVAKVG